MLSYKELQIVNITQNDYNSEVVSGDMNILYNLQGAGIVKCG